MDYSSMTAAELQAVIAEARTTIEAAETAAERLTEVETLRTAVDDAVAAYATATGTTVLVAWQALAPEGAAAPPTTAPEWKQPTGAHNAYKAGDLITFGGAVYRAKLPTVTWAPKAYPQAWELVG